MSLYHMELASVRDILLPCHTRKQTNECKVTMGRKYVGNMHTSSTTIASN